MEDKVEEETSEEGERVLRIRGETDDSLKKDQIQNESLEKILEKISKVQQLEIRVCFC